MRRAVRCRRLLYGRHIDQGIDKAGPCRPDPVGGATCRRRAGGDAGTSTQAGGQELCVDGARRRGVLRGEANMGCSIRLIDIFLK